MKIFIINLKKAKDKRQNMKMQLEHLGIKNYEFIEAVYGADLSLDFINENVYDYPDCALTPGEIGCALSHLYVYERMIKENLPYAMILEDDIILPDDFPELLEAIPESIDVPQSKVITLGEANKITLLNKYFNFKGYSEYTAVTAFCAYAYLINIAAAKSLSEKLRPIKYEADMFIHFRENGWLEQFHVFYPQYVHPIEEYAVQSDLMEEREVLKKKRHIYKKYYLNRKRPISLRLKSRLQRLFWKIKQIRPLD